MDATLRVQNQIRHNAEEVSSYLSNLVNWEKSIKKKDKNILYKRSSLASNEETPVRKGVGTVPTATSVVLPMESGNSRVGTAANHTYDIGYNKWENFDVDAAINENEDGQFESPQCRQSQQKQQQHTAELNPTTIIPQSALNGESQSRIIPAARGVFVNPDAEAAEREYGNKEFSNGNFTAAVKSYTKCLGMKGKNYIAFSNRAMAYLKLKEYHRAESDCNLALLLVPNHTKSLLRRATARNALGKHRAALADLMTALEEDPSNKNIRGELQRTKEALLSAVNRAPMMKLNVVVGAEEEDCAGPDLPV